MPLTLFVSVVSTFGDRAEKNGSWGRAMDKLCGQCEGLRHDGACVEVWKAQVEAHGRTKCTICGEALHTSERNIKVTAHFACICEEAFGPVAVSRG